MDPVTSSVLSVVGVAGTVDACFNLYDKLIAVRDYDHVVPHQVFLLRFERTRFVSYQPHLRKLSSTTPTPDVDPLDHFVLSNLQNLQGLQESLLKKAKKLESPHDPEKGKHHELAWVAADKARLQSLADGLRTLNDILERILVPKQQAGLLGFQVLSAAISELKDEKQLEIAYQVCKSRYSEVAITAKQKQMLMTLNSDRNSGTDSASSPMPDQKIEWDDLELPEGSSRMDDRETGYLGAEKVLVECREAFQTGGGPMRLDNICAMLQYFHESTVALSMQVSKNEVQLLRCIGWTSPDIDSGLGFVFRYPDNSSSLISLKDVLSSGPTPELGARFRLALALSKTLRHLFLIGWTHQNLTSSNIMFSDTDASLNHAFLMEFSYARPIVRGTGKVSRRRHERRFGFEKQNYMHRPDNYAFQFKLNRDALEMQILMAFDIYALGVILLEIGLWKSADSIKQTRSEEEKFDVPLGKYLWKYVRGLDPVVGKVYRGVVEKCLQEGNRDWRKRTIEEAAQIAIWVSQELEKCSG